MRFACAYYTLWAGPLQKSILRRCYVQCTCNKQHSVLPDQIEPVTKMSHNSCHVHSTYTYTSFYSILCALLNLSLKHIASCNITMHKFVINFPVKKYRMCLYNG